MKKFDKIAILLEENKDKHFWLFFIVLIIMTYCMMESFFPGDYILEGHDIHLHILRIRSLMEALSDGRFPIYIDYSAILGYGYPTKWFYPDILLVPFALLGNITSAVFAYKAILVTTTILTGIFMYAGTNRIYKSTYTATIAALLYTFAFYRVQDIFERAALGESISMTFIPLVFWGLYEIIKGDYKKWYIITIGFSLLIFSHVIATLLTFIIVAIFLFVYYKPLIQEKIRIYYLLLAGIVTVFVTAYFLLPLLEQLLSNSFYYKTNVIFKLENCTMEPLFLYLSIFGVSFHPFAYGIFLPGIGSIIGIIACLRIFIRKQKSEALKGADVATIISVASILACLPIFPWGIFPFNLLEVIQFPWRLFELATFLLSVSGAYYTSLLIKTTKRRCLFTIFLIMCTLITTYREAQCRIEQACEYKYHYEISASNIYCQGTLEYAPEKVPNIEYMEERGDLVDTKYGDTQISNFAREKAGITSFYVKVNDKPETLELPLFFYKGYSVKLNGEEIPIQESEHGLLELPKVEQSGNIQVAYSGTTLQKVSPIISIVSIILLCLYIFIVRRKN